MSRGVWISWVVAIVSLSWAAYLGAQPAAGNLVTVRVRGVTMDPQAGSPIVLLEEVQGDRVMPIWVGMFEARAIAMEMEKIVPPRPMTHDLIKDLLVNLKAQVNHIIISDLKDNTFYARIAVTAGDLTLQVDARPSDAIALALRLNAPIYVAQTVFEQAPAIVWRGDEGTSVTVLKRQGLTLQNLSAALAGHFHLPSAEGVLVSDVEAGSAAARDGLRRGDVIVAANHAKVTNLESLDATLQRGGEVSLQIMRRERRLTLVLHLPNP